VSGTPVAEDRWHPGDLGIRSSRIDLECEGPANRVPAPSAAAAGRAPPKLSRALRLRGRQQISLLGQIDEQKVEIDKPGKWLPVTHSRLNAFVVQRPTDVEPARLLRAPTSSPGKTCSRPRRRSRAYSAVQRPTPRRRKSDWSAPRSSKVSMATTRETVGASTRGSVPPKSSRADRLRRGGRRGGGRLPGRARAQA
jgi:hypothetical protein